MFTIEKVWYLFSFFGNWYIFSPKVVSVFLWICSYLYKSSITTPNSILPNDPNKLESCPEIMSLLFPYSLVQIEQSIRIKSLTIIYSVNWDTRFSWRVLAWCTGFDSKIESFELLTRRVAWRTTRCLRVNSSYLAQPEMISNGVLKFRSMERTDLLTRDIVCERFLITLFL